MKTWNALIYHCQRCGRVVHQAGDAPPPSCCERTMSLAATETVVECESPKGSATRDAVLREGEGAGYRPLKPK
ncbi:MAG: hypothetical protein ACT4QC_12000 [Planctomycetaceae bacterium]